MNNADLSRREFLTVLAVAGGGLALAGQARAQAAPLAETDPTAMALGYKADATKVDAKKFPSYKAGQNCAGCKLLTGAEGEAQRPCSIFPGKTVAAAGWCAAFAPK